MSRIRTLVFLPVMSWGGAEKQGLLLAEFLKASGHDVTVWSLADRPQSDRIIDWLVARGIRAKILDLEPSVSWWFGPKRHLVSYVREWYRKWRTPFQDLARRLPDGNFDYVIPFTPWPSLISCVLQRRLGPARCVWNHRGGYDAAGIWYSRYLVGRVRLAFPVFVANSSAGARFLADTFGVSLPQVRVVPNAFTPDFQSRANTRGPRDSGPVRLVHVANLYGEKDIETPVRAVALLKQRGVSITLDVCGYFPEPSEQQRCSQLILDLGVEAEVRLRGALPPTEIGATLGSADVGILSSRSEGAPNSVMEYMYAALPVIGTQIEGIREVVGEGNSRWLFSVGNWHALADLIQDLMSDEPRRRQIGESNRASVLARYNPERAMAAWVDALSIPIEGACRNAGPHGH